MPKIVEILKRSGKDFLEDECTTTAAALSYFTVFALPPLLVLILLLLGVVLDPQDVQGALARQIEQLMGPTGAREVRTIIANADRPGGGGALATVLGFATLLVGATGVFLQLQAALNKAWEVQPDPETGGIKAFLAKRMLSFGMILGLAFLLLVSLAVSAILSALGDMVNQLIGGGVSDVLLLAVEFAVSLAVIALLFGAIFKYLPDAEVEWRDVRAGAIATAILFAIGKFLIGFYLGRSNPGEAFGAAGSLALLLVWIYYSSIIVLFGAEFTQAWAWAHGREIVPEKGAVRVVVDKRRVGEGATGGPR
jgi:membrane protein